MKLTFYKYHGTGNDFIMIDNRDNSVNIHSGIVVSLCHRRFGVGADGLILLGTSGEDFTMTYYNSDGGLSTMCGNGGRCITAFARILIPGITHFRFMAADGLHDAQILEPVEGGFIISLGMSDVSTIISENGDFILDTGSPHFVRFIAGTDSLDLIHEARKLRYSERFEKEGINVNFVSEIIGGIKMRTYERGVEDETLSCGTGTVAASLASLIRNNSGPGVHIVHVKAPGGELSVQAKKHENGFSDIRLIGPAVMVFKGEYVLD